MCTRPHSTERRRYTQAKLQIPKIARPKSRKEPIEIKFEEKFTSSYYACAPSSYRRKRSLGSDNGADVEKEMMRNIQEFRQSIAEHNERILSKDDNDHNKNMTFGAAYDVPLSSSAAFTAATHHQQKSSY